MIINFILSGIFCRMCRMSIRPELFSVLQRRNTHTLHARAAAVDQQVFFKLDQEEEHFYFESTDSSGKPLHVAPESCTGSLKTVMDQYHKALKQLSWQIGWGGERKLYLDEHQHLSDSILSYGNILDGQNHPVIVSPAAAALQLRIEQQDDLLLSSTVQLVCSDGTIVSAYDAISTDLVLASGVIYRIDPIDEYPHLPLFTCILTPDLAPQLIGLFATLYRDVRILYKDHTVRTGRTYQTRPAVLFEHIDDTGALHLRLVNSCDEVALEYLTDYAPEITAVIDDELQELVLHPVTYTLLPEEFQRFERMLKRHQKKGSHSSSYLRIEDLFIIEPDLAHSFIEEDLAGLLEHYSLAGTKELAAFNIKSSTPKVSMSLESSGIDFLASSVDVQIGDDHMSVTDLFSSYDSKRYIVLSDGTKAVVPPQLVRRLRRLLTIDRKGKVSLSFFDLPLVQQYIDEKTSAGAVKASRKVLEGFNRLESYRPGAYRIKATLRDYQHKGYLWLQYLKEHRFGGCLADDMGLGKTMQSIALLSEVYTEEQPPSLIIMPVSLLFNWQRECETFAPQLSVSIYHGPGRDLTECLGSQIILTTYHTARSDIAKLREITFCYIILDESQNIKNLNSQISKAVMLLDGTHRLALSGTPIENNIYELYSLFRFLNPSMFGTAAEFKRRYAKPIADGDDEQVLSDVKRKIYPFLLRRLKTEVMAELPPKSEQVLYVEMSAAHAALYERRRKFYQEAIANQISQQGLNSTRFFILQALSELRQIASIPENHSGSAVSSPKVEILGESISEAVSNGHKALLFANYLDALSLVEDELTQRKISYLKITGATKDRKSIVDAFQQGDQYQVLLMTLKTGGIGLNLTAADYVFIFDPWWNTAAEQQAVDRTHRIGQTKAVFSYKLIVKDTIEEKILELQRHKEDLIDALIDSDGSAMKSLDEKDIEFMLSDGRRQPV